MRFLMACKHTSILELFLNDIYWRIKCTEE